ncbi:MAG: hypothetical protein KAS32_20125 [Candidatus Peribacteraceae bacterium]|nr:hypothetical protein [Candidatus Peribacteraceae bacterium]
MKTISVTKHAVDRYVERTGTKEKRYDQLVRTIIEKWNGAKPVELKSRHRITHILRHGYVDKKVEYRLNGLIIFVVVDNSLVTVRPNDKRLWREIL